MAVPASPRTEDRVTDDPVTSALTREAWERLRSISHDPAMLHEHHALMEEYGIKLGPMKALRFLPLDGSTTMRQLAAALRCDNSYVTAVVDGLEDRDLAHRRPHPGDRRVKEIVLTDAGRVAAGRAQAVAERPPAAFANLSDDEVATLCAILRKLDPDG